MMSMGGEMMNGGFLILDELARDMREDMDAADELAGQLADDLNKHIKDARTVAVNGVNLCDVHSIAFACGALCGGSSLGILFFGGDDEPEQRAFIVLDAEQANLKVETNEAGDLVSITTVDKLGRPLR